MNELYNNYFQEINDIIWKAAIYVRLSREDEEKENESESISNQRSFILDFLKENNYTFKKIDETTPLKQFSPGVCKKN